MIHLYTGEGKGKTTAAIGLAARAAGRDLKICFAQFMKGNDTGELYTLRRLPNVDILRSPKNFGFFKTMSEADRRELTEIHDNILDELTDALRNRRYDLIVLDEITHPVNKGLADAEKVKRILALAGEKDGGGTETELVLTGRDPADFFAEAADYITEMKCIRHPFEKGIAARRGVEF